MAGVYRSTQASGVDTLSRYDPNTLAFLESITDVTSPVVVDGKLWGVGTGSRAETLVRLNVDDVTDVLETVAVPGLTEWSASYLPYETTSASGDQVSTTQQPDPDEIDVRVRCRREDWSEARTSVLFSRKSGGGFGLTTINPYQVLLVSGEFRFGIRTGGVGYRATETAANLGCINGEWRWLRFTYNDTSYNNDNPTAEWRRRFWSSDDGVSWTQVSSSALTPGGALDTGTTSTRLRVGNETENNSGWNGDISHLIAYDQDDSLIHDLALVDVGSPVSGANSWTATSTGEPWTAGSGINPAGTGYGYTLSGDGDSLLLASRNTGFDLGSRDRLRDVEILQRRDATTGGLIWQVDGYECGFSPEAALDDGSYIYIGNKERATTYRGHVARLNRSDGSFIDNIVLPTSQNDTDRMVRIGGVLYLRTESGISEVDFGASTSTLIVTELSALDIDTDSTYLYLVRSAFLSADLVKYQSDGTELLSEGIAQRHKDFVRYDNKLYLTGRSSGFAGILSIATDLVSDSVAVQLTNTDLPTGFAVLYQNPPTPGAGWVVGAVGW